MWRWLSMKLALMQRLTLALVSLTLVVSLSGCWAVAAPLIGVGVVGGGAGVYAASRHSGKAPPDPEPTYQGNTDIAESVPNDPIAQPADSGSPLIASLPAPSPAAVPSQAATAREAHHRKPRAHHRKTKAIARASKPKRLQGPSQSVASSPKPMKSQSAAVASSPLTAPPDALPSTQIVH